MGSDVADREERALERFGFTRMESATYCALLREAPATGYKLAKRINKAPANVYQALKSLHEKGAVAIDAATGDAQAYVPVPPDQLFGSLRRTFEAQADAALDHLKTLHRPPPDESVMTFRTVPQVLERARAMLAGAEEVIVFDIVPPLYDALKADIDRARARGVVVAGIAYREEDVHPTVPFSGETPEEVTARWPGLGLILIRDGCEQIVAQLSRDQQSVLNAVYSDSPFLSCILHSAVASDLRLVALRTDPSDPLDFIALSRLMPPGMRALNALANGSDP